MPHQLIENNATWNIAMPINHNYLEKHLYGNYSDGRNVVTSEAWNSTDGATCMDIHVIPLFTLNITLGIISLLINGFVLYIVNNKRAPYNVHRHLVNNLIASYIIVGVCWVIIWCLALSNFSRCKQWPCQCLDGFLILLNNTGVIGSIIYILTMSFEHYVALFQPLQFKRLFTRKRMNVTVGCLWLLTILCSCSSFSEAIYMYFSTSTDFCEVFSSATSDKILHYILLTILCVSMVTLACIYIRICVDRKAMYRVTHNVNGSVSERSHKKLLKTTLLVWGTFVLCWTPFFLLTLATSDSDIGQMSCRCQAALMYLSAMPVINAVCGPVIYTFRSYNLKEDFTKLCCTSCRRTGYYNPGVITVAPPT